MAYNGSVELAAGIKPKNNGSFPMVNAHDVYVDDSTRLDAKLTSLGNSASIATTEASSTASSAHAVGSYLFLDGTLYEVTAAISVGDTIEVGTNVATVPGGLSGEVSDLKSAVGLVGNGTGVLDATAYENTLLNYTIKDDATANKANSTGYRSYQIPRRPEWKKITATGNSSNNGYITFVKEALSNSLVTGDSVASSICAGADARYQFAKNTTATYTIPDDCAYLVIMKTSNNASTINTPESITMTTAMQTEIDGKQDTLTFDDSPTSSSTNPVTSGGVYTALAGKQDTLTFDSVPASNSTNPVTSGGIYNALITAIQNGVAEKIDCSAYTKSSGRILSYGTYKTTSGYKYILFPVESGWKKLIIHQPLRSAEIPGTYRSSGVAFLTSSTLIVDQTAPLCIGETGSRELKMYDTVAFDIPADCAYIYVLVRNNGSSNNVEPYMYAVSEGSALDVVTDFVPGQLPTYYYSYLESKEAQITAVQNTLSANNDAFLFITDYHDGSNATHSYDMIRHVSNATGITNLIYTGDSGGGNATSKKDAEKRLRESAAVWDNLQRQVDSFWGAIGNHEWISGGYITQGAIFGAYLNRFKGRCGGMDDHGDYWYDNPVNKIRYIGLQQSVGAEIDADQLDWFGDTLTDTPNGYSVLVFAHHGYIPNESSSAEYDGATISGANHDSESGSHLWARRVNQVLHAYETGGTLTLTVNNVSHPFDFTGKTGTVIGVFCGHYHHGTLFEKDDTYNTEQIPVFRGGSDTLRAATVSGDNNEPWYWKDGIITGQKSDKILRTIGTTDEQCFYAVQIDLDAKKVYITAIGGDHDWEFEYGNS